MFGADFKPVLSGHQIAAALHHFGAAHDPFGPRPFIAVDLQLAVNLGPQLAGALGHRLGDIGRVNIAVFGVVKRAFKVIRADQRPAGLDVIRREEFILDAHRIGGRGIEHVFVHTLLRLGHAQVAHHRKACIQPGFSLQRFVEINRILVDMAGGVTHVEQRQKAGGVPGGTGCQLVTLDQNAFPAGLGQMIGNARPYGPAANNQCFDLGFHRSLQFLMIW